MDASAIVQMVSTVGFPIAMCLLLAWYIKSTGEAHAEQISTITREHKEEVTQMTTAINNNTLTIQKLVDLLSSQGEHYE